MSSCVQSFMVLLTGSHVCTTQSGDVVHELFEIIAWLLCLLVMWSCRDTETRVVRTCVLACTVLWMIAIVFCFPLFVQA